MRILIGLATIASLTPSAVIAKPRYLLRLAGPHQEFVALKVDTAGLQGVIYNPDFTVVLKAGNARTERPYSMIGGSIVALRKGRIYEVFRRHYVKGAESVALKSGLTWAVSAEGGKPDGLEKDSEIGRPDIVDEPEMLKPVNAVRTTPAFCKSYAAKAVAQQRANRKRQCKFTSGRWDDDREGHEGWCLSTTFAVASAEQDARSTLLDACQ